LALRSTKQLLRWYVVHGRTHLPWRKSRDPYDIVVSEFMLQQTQVDRVVASYERFTKIFPSFERLAAATRSDVVREWKGLGYNLRAVRLHDLACAVVQRHGGKLPSDEDALRALPGIGPYTAAAIRAFAFELDDVAVDVNVRRVLHRLCFGLEHPPKANASQLDFAARQMLPSGRAHAWNSALMDLGAAVCTARAPKCERCPLRAGCAAAEHGAAEIGAAAQAHLAAKRRGPQARLPFRQTRRYLRGRILDRLRDLEPGAVLRTADFVVERYPLEEILAGMERDGLVVRDGAGIRLR
jgi:A/G-specific adenine glycosylase